MLHRFNVTNPDNVTLSIVAKDATQARGKAWIRFIKGVPFLRVGRAIRYDRNAVLRWLADRNPSAASLMDA
jgi:hypothetical protein